MNKKTNIKEIKDYFKVKQAKSIKEVEEWCKRQLNRKINK